MDINASTPPPCPGQQLRQILHLVILRSLIIRVHSKTEREDEDRGGTEGERPRNIHSCRKPLPETTCGMYAPYCKNEIRNEMHHYITLLLCSVVLWTTGWLPQEAAERRTAHDNNWNGVNGVASTHVFYVFDTILLIPLQPLPQARPLQLRCHHRNRIVQMSPGPQQFDGTRKVNSKLYDLCKAPGCLSRTEGGHSGTHWGSPVPTKDHERDNQGLARAEWGDRGQLLKGETEDSCGA
jgi:hypothetical protein